MLTFGPVPSRRLGRSLGINNIPPKICSLSCIYCQVGRTDRCQISRESFYDPETIFRDVETRLNKTRHAGESIDFLTFVPDGEPTLDSNLGRGIDLLRPLGVKIAVISNSSLIWQESVKNDLRKADLVSFKVDAVDQNFWRRINRPHPDLNLSVILEAMLQFNETYEGKLLTETMLVHGVNDSPDNISGVADFLKRLQPAEAYLSIPTRPPTEGWVQPPKEDVLNMAYQVIRKRFKEVECLFGYEGNTFSVTGNAEEDLLNIIAVHPMQEEAVREFLAQAGADWTLIDNLLAQGRLLATNYEGRRFFLRRLER